MEEIPRQSNGNDQGLRSIPLLKSLCILQDWVSGVLIENLGSQENYVEELVVHSNSSLA